jgi:hypothetical protein
MTPENALTIVGMTVSATIVGTTAAWAWFRASKARIYSRIEKMEKEMNTYAARHQDWHIENKVELHGIKIANGYIEQALKDLKVSSDSTTNSLERLIQALVMEKSRKNGDGG